MKQHDRNTQIGQVSAQEQSHGGVWIFGGHQFKFPIGVLSSLAFYFYVRLPRIDPEVRREAGAARKEEGARLVAPPEALSVEPQRELHLESASHPHDSAIASMVGDWRRKWLARAVRVGALKLGAEGFAISRIASQPTMMMNLQIASTYAALRRIWRHHPRLARLNSALAKALPNDFVGEAEVLCDARHRPLLIAVEANNFSVIGRYALTSHA